MLLPQQKFYLLKRFPQRKSINQLEALTFVNFFFYCLRTNRKWVEGGRGTGRLFDVVS